MSFRDLKLGPREYSQAFDFMCYGKTDSSICGFCESSVELVRGRYYDEQTNYRFGYRG